MQKEVSFNEVISLGVILTSKRNGRAQPSIICATHAIQCFGFWWLLCLSASTSAQSCLLPGAEPWLLPVYTDATGTVSCKPGFYCPLLNPLNLSTYPVNCPPLPECTLDRLFGRLCGEPQGTFEPMVCPKGRYCPRPNVNLECPSGSVCAAGTVDPKEVPLALHMPCRVPRRTVPREHRAHDHRRCRDCRGGGWFIRKYFSIVPLSFSDEDVTPIESVSGK